MATAWLFVTEVWLEHSMQRLNRIIISDHFQHDNGKKKHLTLFMLTAMTWHDMAVFLHTHAHRFEKKATHPQILSILGLVEGDFLPNLSWYLNLWEIFCLLVPSIKEANPSPLSALGCQRDSPWTNMGDVGSLCCKEAMRSREDATKTLRLLYFFHYQVDPQPSHK